MNIGTGIFKAPKAGTYSFDFSFTKTTSTADTFFEFQLNGSKIGINFAGYGTNLLLSNSIQATLKLKVGDQISFVLGSGAIYDDDDHFTHFTGSLLEEDLTIIP